MEELLAADFPDCDDESSSSSEDVLADSSDQDQFDNNEETGSSEPRVHDSGIQCYCQPVTLRSVAVQTEDSKPKKNKANVTPTPIQNEPYMYVPPRVDAVQRKVLKDHTYSLPACPSSVFPTYDDNFFRTIPFTQLHKEDSRLQNDDDNVNGHVSDTDDEVNDEDLQSRTKLLEKVFPIISTFLRNKTISKTTPLRKENPFPQFNVASHKRPGIRLSFEYTTTLLSGEGGEGRTNTAMMLGKMLSKYTIFSTVLSKIVYRVIRVFSQEY